MAWRNSPVRPAFVRACVQVTGHAVLAALVRIDVAPREGAFCLLALITPMHEADYRPRKLSVFLRPRFGRERADTTPERERSPPVLMPVISSRRQRRSLGWPLS